MFYFKSLHLWWQVLGRDYILIEQPAKPKVKIFTIACDFKSTEVMQYYINEHYFCNFDNKCKILNVFKSANNMKGAIVELSCDLNEYIVDNKYKIYIGYQCWGAFDWLIITPCPRCSRFNNNAKEMF